MQHKEASTLEQEQDLRRRFSAILERAKHLGITDEQLAGLDSVSDLRLHAAMLSPGEASRRLCRVRTIFGGILILLMFLVSEVVFQWPVGRESLVAFAFGFDHEGFGEQQCLLQMDSMIIQLARPPVDCRMCHRLMEVDRVSGVSAETFETRYAYTGRPVVVTDAMANWTAPQTFSFEFFRGIYTADSPVFAQGVEAGGSGGGQGGSCQFFPYRTSFRNLSEVFEMGEERARMSDGSEPWYIGWSNCDSAAANTLRAHYQRPYFLPGVAESSRTDWIFMGSPGYGADMHIDNVNNPSWQAQVTGVKHWTLEPPPECYLECQQSIQVVVHPGEIIVLDTNQWFHSTRITGTDMSITIGSEYD